jgi:hypothetical protein
MFLQEYPEFLAEQRTQLANQLTREKYGLGASPLLKFTSQVDDSDYRMRLFLFS